MATNFRESGNRISVTLAGDATSGVPMAVGTIAGIPITGGVADDVIAVSLAGVWTLTTALTSQTTGTLVDWDISAAAVVASEAGDFPLGRVFDQPVAGEVNVLVNGIPAPHNAP